MTFDKCIGSSSDLSETDCQAWQALYSSTGGSKWDFCSDKRLDPCSCNYRDVVGLEHGVTCDNNRITKLDLDTVQLIGSIPTEIGNLDSLTRFAFADSYDLVGNIPTEIGTLSRLNTMILQFTQLSGYIPTEIGNLGSLTELYLNSNGLNGNIPTEIGKLGSLTQLYLNNNSFSGSIPIELGTLKFDGVLPDGVLPECKLSSNKLCFPSSFKNNLCKGTWANKGIPPCPSLYSCINGNCTITNDTGGTYYQNSCNIYCTKQKK